MVVFLYQHTPQAARWALMEAGPVCVSYEVRDGDPIPDLGQGSYAYKARFVGIENDQRVFKLIKLLPASSSEELSA